MAPNRSENGIYTSPWGGLPDITPGTVYEHAFGRLRVHGAAHDADSRLAIADYVTGERWTVQQVKEVTTRLAAAILFAHEAKPGDNVLISFPSGPIFGLLSMACLRAGVVPALANPVYTPHELRHVCKLVGAKLILTAPMLRPGFEEANIQGATIVNCSRPVKGDEAGDSLWQRLEGIALEQAEQILARSGANDVSWDKPAGIFFSSGTTGLPKAVVLSHKNIIVECQSLYAVPGMLKHPLGASTLPTNKALNYLPGFHIAGFAGMLLGMLVGDENHFIIKSPLDVPLIVRAIKELRPHRIIMVPPLLMAIARLGLAGSEGFRDSVGHVYCAAAPLGTEQQREAHEALGIHVGQLWGMSETTGAATATSCIEPFRPGSGGRVMPGFELRLVDEGGKDVKHGDRGEILVRSGANMMCYYRNEKETSDTIDKDGWLRTGDVAYMDGDGHIFIVDRRKELIKCKGFQVAPAELEALLMTHPSIMDAGVTGIRDADGDESPRAFVVLRPQYAKGVAVSTIDGKAGPLRPSTDATAKEIAAFVAKRAAHYKQLRAGVVYVQEIPKNPSGKILRRVLRDLSVDQKARM